MTNEVEEVIEILTKYKKESEEDYYVKRAKALDMAIKALEKESDIKELGNELRLVRGGIKGNKDMLCGYNLAVSICNKWLEKGVVE